jgi:hypothetical protein
MKKSDFDRPPEYYDDIEIPFDKWREICRFKDQATALFDRRWQEATAVIDLVARKIGIDPDTTGDWLYGLYDDETSPLADKLDEYFDRGDKVKLKKRIDELETENRILRSLIGKE